MSKPNDKNGEINVINNLKDNNKSIKNFQCLFMLRNCHLPNSILVGDGELLILDPIRLSLNKLNINTGTEQIILHSLKFLFSIKHILQANSKIYFIDISGNLYNFNETEKKITQVGSSGICKYVIDFVTHRHFLFTIENTTLYRTNLSDGHYVEIKCEYVNNLKFFFADNTHVVFINNYDIIFLLVPDIAGEYKLQLLRKFKFENISKMSALTYFKNQLIFYNNENSSIECLNLKIESDKEIVKIEESKQNSNKLENVFILKSKIMTENFPKVSLFINNTECLGCILKDGAIYKLF